MSLDGILTREQRVLIAKDVISTISSQQERITMQCGVYLRVVGDDSFFGELHRDAQLNSTSLDGPCEVCARGALFLASIDRYNNCTVGDALNAPTLGVLAADHTQEDWGDSQVDLIEAAFETRNLAVVDDVVAEEDLLKAAAMYMDKSEKERMILICENIIANNGEFRPA